MKLSRGTRLGPYEIDAPLGAGGMGEVYRARDTRLDRIVAIKIIIGGDAASAAMRERFDREARAIALLSHPHICTLHDIGHHEGTAFLVMEYLEGETLADRLSRQKPRSSAGSTTTPRPPRPPPTGDAARGPASRAPLPLDETIRIATQLADALTAAHRAGIVHRDLKPGNIMLTRSGVKVLDFGLAKLKPSGDVGVNAASTMTDLPLTGEGMLVGTVPYMAPEQLEGRGIDHRTDIFAFGGIVYEMATGRRAFAGESQASLIAAILDREPDPISSDQPLTPPGLERLVRKCLAKDPDGRWQAASDIADELRWLSTGGGSAALAPSASAGRKRLGGWAVAAGVVLLAAVATVVVWRGSPLVTPQAPRREMTYTQATFAGDVSAAALSPDGRTVAYASGAEGHVRLFVRDLVGSQSLEIWKGAFVSELGWLPNGSQLVVASLRDTGSAPELWLVSRLGGASRLVGPRGARVAVSPDGSQLAHGTQSFAGFNLSALDGTGTRQVPLQGFRWLNGLHWNAPTNRIAVLTSDDENRSIVWSVTPEGKDLRQLYSDAAWISAMCSSPLAGVLYLFRDRHGAQELVKLAITGAQAQTASVLTSGVQQVAHLNCNCSVSADGERLLYVRRTGHANLWRLDLRHAASTATALTRGTSTLFVPRVSPDGQWIVASQQKESAYRIVRMPLAGGEFSELATGTGAVWSPDGTRLAFVAGPQRLWVSDPDGRAPQQVKGAESVNDEVTWLPDGRLAWPTSDIRNYRIRDLVSGQEELLVKNSEVGWVFDPAFSPQGDQVAVHWNRTDGPQRRRGLWVLSWPAREERFIAPNLRPVGWSENGDWIYAFEESKSEIVKVSLRTTKIEPVGSFPRGQLVGGSCSMTPDRQSIVCSLNESVADAWIVDHFDPDVQGQRP